MALKIDVEKVRNQRLKQAWSQDQLASIAGLGLRTVHRIENSGRCSLDSLRAMAAAFDMLPGELQVRSEAQVTVLENTQISKRSLPSIALTRLRSVRSYLTGGVIGAALSMAGLMLTDTVVASQVHQAVEGTIDHQGTDAGHAVTSSPLIKEGRSAAIEISELLRIEFTPAIQADDAVLLQTRVFTWENDAFVPLASPADMPLDSEQATNISMSLPSGRTVDFSLTPHTQQQER